MKAPQNVPHVTFRPRSFTRSCRLLAGGLAGLLLGVAGDSFAATRTWSGSTDTNWSTLANWGGTAPANGDILVFSGTTRRTNYNDISSLSLIGVGFGTTGWNITGNPITLAGGMTNNVSSSSSIWGLDTTLSGNLIVYQNTASATLRLTGAFSGVGGLQRPAGSTGQGNLHLLNTNNSYTGASVLQCGTTYAYRLGLSTENSSFGTGNGNIQIGTTGSAYVGNLTYLGDTPSTTDRHFSWRYNPTSPNNAMNLLNNSPNSSPLVFTGSWDINPGGAGVSWTLNLGGSAVATNVVDGGISMAGSSMTLPVNLRVTGPGTWAFGQTINVLGSLLVTNNASCVLLASAILNGPAAITVFPGSVLDVTSFTNGLPFELGTYNSQTLTAGGGSASVADVAGTVRVGYLGSVNVARTAVAGTLTISSNFIPVSGTLQYDLGTDTTPGAGINDLIAVGGDLDLSQGQATVVVKPLNGITIGTPYTLITYSGSLVGDASGITVPSPGRSFSAGIVSTATPGKVTVTFQSSGVPVANLVWQGDGSLNYWDSGLFKNWLNGATLDYFYSGDNVIFDDTSVNTNIDLYGLLSPMLMTVNTTNAYSWGSTSGGSLTGGSLIKKGSGALALNTVNSFSGDTVLSAGTIIAAANNSLGSGNIILGDTNSAANPVVLVIDKTTTLGNPMTVSSDATGPVAVRRGDVSGNCSFLGAVTLERNVTFYATIAAQNAFVFKGGVQGSGDVTLRGGGVMRWEPSNCSFAGNFYVTEAGTHFDCNATLPAGMNLDLAEGTEFGLVSSPNINALTGSGRVLAGLGVSSWNPTLTVGAGGGSGTFAGTFGTNGYGYSCNLIKAGGGTQTLTGDSSLSIGGTTVSAGVLEVNNTTGTGLGTGNVTVNAAGTLAGKGTVASATGTMTVNGAVSVGSAGDTAGASFSVTNNGITINAGGAISVDLFSGAGAGDNSGTAAAADVLNVLTTNVVLNAGAVLNIGNPNGMTAWALGDKWKVINWSTPPTGALTVNGPSLPPNLWWDKSQLYTAGIIALTTPPPPPVLVATYSANTLTLAWTNGVLQAAPEVAGSYTNVPGATSPYVITDLTRPQEYFRLVLQ